MLIAGLLKHSFIDYPGKICCVLFTTGCNFVCPYCHNADLARGEYPERIDLPQIIDFLHSRQRLLEGVTITGGEPTLHSGIVDLCQTVKSMGLALKLDTNGSRPQTLQRLIENQLVDFVAMDIKAPLDAYGPFSPHPRIQEQLMESIRLVMRFAPAYEFRTTCAGPFAAPNAIAAIARTIRGAQWYALQTFNRQAQCLDPAFSRRQDASPTSTHMQRLQAVAAPFVQRCIIR